MTRITTKRATWHAQRAVNSVLDPVTLGVHCGIADVQDYLTPDEARRLAAALVAVADAVEEEES